MICTNMPKIPIIKLQNITIKVTDMYTYHNSDLFFIWDIKI